MIYLFSKEENKTIDNSGDGSREKPWYWNNVSKNNVADVNNNHISEDNGRLYFRVKLKSGVEYQIGQTSPDDGDGKIWLYSENYNEITYSDDDNNHINGIDCSDAFYYEPSEDGVYIVGAGAYSSSRGDYKVTIYPSPEYEEAPDIQVLPVTSSGFNPFGRAIGYRSASAANCALSLIPTLGLSFYAPFVSSDSVAKTGQELSIPDDVVFDSYLGFDCVKISSNGIESEVNSEFSSMTIVYMLNSNISDTWLGLFHFSKNDWRAYQGNGDFISIKTEDGDQKIEINNFVGEEKNYYRDGNWHLFVHTIANGLQQTYVDGELYATSNYSVSSFPSGANTVCVGESGDGDYMNGSYVSQFMLYNRVLTEKEVSAIYKRLIGKSEEDDLGVDLSEPLTVYRAGTNNSLTVTLTKTGTPDASKIQYRYGENDTWKYLDESGGESTSWVLTMNATNGYEIQFQNLSNTLCQDADNYFTFSSSANIGCRGNVMSLLNYSDTCTDYCFYRLFRGCKRLTVFPTLPSKNLATYCYGYMLSGCNAMTETPRLPATTLAESCYRLMFSSCTGLKTISKISATTLAGYCFYQMFYKCTALETPPELPWTELTTRCYAYMFYGCTSLKEMPVLPSTTLATYCYYQMFYGCTSLTKTTELPAPTLLTNCYNQMFYGCSSLNYLKVGFTKWSPSSATSNWLEGVSAEGTFVCPSSLSVEYGAGKIPESWTVTNE